MFLERSSSADWRSGERPVAMVLVDATRLLAADWMAAAEEGMRPGLLLAAICSCSKLELTSWRVRSGGGDERCEESTDESYHIG
jgi:hypothetical protein